MTKTIEHDHFPELAENGGAYMLAEQIGLSENELASAELRREAFLAKDPEDIAASVIRLNAVLRRKSPDDAIVEDGKIGSDTPPFDEKGQLLKEAAAAFQTILANEDLDDQKALRRAALTMAGAIVYIHASENANGRTARSFQYLAEFGSERGEELMEAEMFSAIGKAAVYDVDMRKSVDTEPLFEMEGALNAYCSRTYADEWQQADGRTKAGMRVRAFLDAMTGKADIRMDAPVSIAAVQAGKLATLGEAVLEDGKYRDVGRTFHRERIEPGESIAELYERNYTALSFAAHVAPEDIPAHAQRVAVHKREETQKIRINADLV